MDIAIFHQMLALHGADLSRWPEDMVNPALALMRQNPAAQDAFDRALALDDLLRAWTPPAHDTAALAQAIMDTALWQGEEMPDAAALWRLMPVAELRKAAAGLVMAAFLGVIVGMLPAQAPQDIETLMDPLVYTPDQIVRGDDIAYYQEGLF